MRARTGLRAEDCTILGPSASRKDNQNRKTQNVSPPELP